MPDNSFTLMIIPNRKSGVKKISIPKVLLRNIIVGSLVVIFATLYVIYDYTSIKRDRAELARLRAQTQEQSRQLRELGTQIDTFSQRMEDLRQFDRKIRVLAYETSRGKKLPLGVGGSDDESRIKDLLDKDHDTIIAGMRGNLAKLNEDAVEREKSFSELLVFLQEQKSILAATPSLWPVKGWVTSEFGWRNSPFRSGSEFHNGIDISTRYGKEIIAAADGLVIRTGYDAQEGNAVRIDHGHGFTTAYLHMSKIHVKRGMRVKRGDVIGYVGDTGRSTGSHLHYSVYVNGVAVNPRRYIQ